MSIKKVVVIGPESTGKSTLSEALASCLNTVWVPEYARKYLEKINRPYTEADLDIIALGQLSGEVVMETVANELLICDTDLNVIKVWSEHKYGRCSNFITGMIAKKKYDLYLLTGIDMPWQPDPLREHPDEAMRRHFYSIYENIVQQSGTPWAAINGNEDERLRSALAAIASINW